MKLHRISIAALFLAVFGLVAVPNSAQAQQQGAQEQDPASYESLSSALNNVSTHAQELGRTGDQQTGAQNVRVVNVEEITSDLDDTQRQTLQRTYQNADTKALESAVQNNEAIQNALDQNTGMNETGTDETGANETGTEVDASDVVAVNVRDNGPTVVYVDPNGELEGEDTGDFEQK